MDLLVKLVVVGVVAWAFWLALQPRCAFVVRVREGVPRTVKGVVTAAFLEQLGEVCQQHGVTTATVRGIIQGRRIGLAFSSSIPASGQQQLRNWWALSGWSARSAGRQGPPRRA